MVGFISCLPPSLQSSFAMEMMLALASAFMASIVQITQS